MTLSYDAFLQCGIRDADLARDADTWLWRNPAGPPGLHVMVNAFGDDMRLTLAQDLFGPIGPTETYRCVRKSLRDILTQRFGKDAVHFE
jgi:hypothetical protein